jgi:DNA repair protein RadC
MADTQQTKPHYAGHRKRLRERVLNAKAASLQDYELLEMLLFAGNPRGDTKPLAKILISHFGSLSKVLSASSEDLMKAEGVGESAAASILVVREFAGRLLQNAVMEKPIMQSWKALLDYCHATMGHDNKEQFRIFFLDKKNKLIADEKQQEGTVDHTPVYPREVVKRCLDLGASAIILVHNHPSGDPTPSQEDITMTQQIMQALTPVSVRLHDHLVIGSEEHYSFASNGLL